MAGIFPLPICFIIFAICFRAAMSRFTSSSDVPLPEAILRRRGVEMM